MYCVVKSIGLCDEHGPIALFFERSIRMKLQELREILERFDGEQEVLYSEDGIRCKGVRMVGSLRKIEKDTDGKLKEIRFVYIG